MKSRRTIGIPGDGGGGVGGTTTVHRWYLCPMHGSRVSLVAIV